MSALEFAKKMCKENEGKVFMKSDVDPGNVILFCNRPDLATIPDEEKNWHYEKGMFTNKPNNAEGRYEKITVLPKFYMDYHV